MKKWCIGRFSFALPDEYEQTGRSQSIYGVEVLTIPIPQGKDQDFWSSRIAEIKTKYVKQGAKCPPPRELEVGPGISAVFHYANPTFPNLITLEAIKRFENHQLSLRYEGRTDKQMQIQKIIKLTADRYVAGASEGFCIGAGAIREPSRHEYIHASFRNNTLDIELTVSMQTVGAILAKHPLDDIEHQKQSLSSEGIQLKILENRRRVVCGLNGFEGRVLTKSDEGAYIHFTWFYAGTTGNSFGPEILIKVFAPEKQHSMVESHWEGILKSFCSTRKGK